jgi:hypothetical protein
LTCDFWAENRERKTTADAKAMDSVASPFGLRSGLRQSGRAFRPRFLGTAEAVPLSKTECLRSREAVPLSNSGCFCSREAVLLRQFRMFLQPEKPCPFWCRAVGGVVGEEECEGVVAGRGSVIPPIAKCAMDGAPGRFVPANGVRGKSKNKGGHSSFVCRGGL